MFWFDNVIITLNDQYTCADLFEFIIRDNHRCCTHLAEITDEFFPLRYDRMTMLRAKRNKFATVNVRGPKPSIFKMPEKMRTIQPLANRDAAINRKVKLSVGPSLKHGIDFLVNGETHASDKPVRVGDLQIWEVRNASLMDHPFHLHGFFFQVLEINGEAPDYRSWKDTINLKPRSSVKIAWMPDNRPGQWMYHCHILEHHEAGMMGILKW